MNTVATTPSIATLTIGHLARAADVGVETIRYYQERGLLPVPVAQGTYRRYSSALVGRIRFIKRGQELGLTLAEIAELLRLEDGADRPSIRRIANARLAQINHKIADLERMRDVLTHLVDQCEHTKKNLPCPIIATLANVQTTSA
jgi:Hg(II)-responsive transcriptional regulator